jgi:hypothetical protein
MKQVMWLKLVFAVGLLASAGCEVSVGECDKDDAGECVDLFPEVDAAWMSGMDASTDASRPSDAAAPTDSGARPDGALVVDAGLDANVGPADASAPTTLNDQQFCDAQFAVARTWSALLDRLDCNCLSSDDVMGRASFLASTLRYDDSTGSNCLSNFSRLRSAGVTYDGSKGAACAARFAAQFKGPSQFMAPLASCPGGFDIAKLEAAIGHGRQAVAQLPECRAAFVGTKAENAACVDSLECAAGRRCRPIPGGGSSSCQSPRGVNESCTKNDDCIDGHICSLNVQASGSNPAEYSCIPVASLKLQNGNCQTSSECVEGLVCDVTSKKCVNAPSDRICE